MNNDIYVVIEHLQGQTSEISYIMLAAARALTQNTGGEVVGVLLGHQAEGLASNLAADKVLYVDHPALKEFTSDAYEKVIAKLTSENEPRVVLFGNTSIGSDVAGILSSRLALPMINFCMSVTENGNLISQLCGGKIMSESALPDSTTIVTMIPGGYKPEEGMSAAAPPVTQAEAPALDDLRVTLIDYTEPETGDVDISTESILISVGRGIQNEGNIELAEELAELLGGAVCASRPVVDQGWLPTSRMVGKSGVRVKPKLYLAFGISGAPEHLEGITDSEMIIAINTDASAPIFDVAQYGTDVDMFDLFDALIEQVEEA